MEIRINFIDKSEYNERIKAKEFFSNLIKQLSDNLILDSLEYVVFTNDFGKELTEFQKSHNLLVEYTDNELIKAYGKTLPYEKNKEARTAIFLDKKIGLLFHQLNNKEVKRLLNGKESFGQVLTNILHHELCHAYDEHVKFNLFGFKYMYMKRKGLFRTLQVIGDAIWSEYIANKLSVETFPINNTSDIETLQQIILTGENECEKLIENFKVTNNKEVLFHGIQFYSYDILRIITSIYGTMHGLQELGKDCNSFRNHVSNVIKDTYLNVISNDLENRLKEMGDLYPNWKDDTGICKLATVINKYWESMGVSIKETPYELFFSVK